MSSVPPFPYTLVNGVTADAPQVMADLNLVRDYLNAAYDLIALTLPLTGGAISGNLTIAGTLGVTGAVTFASVLSVAGTITAVGINQTGNTVITRVDPLVGLADTFSATRWNFVNNAGTFLISLQGVADVLKLTANGQTINNEPVLTTVRGPNAVLNGSIACSVGANALTFALKGRDGNDPSAANPVYVSFRSATATDGKPVIRTITAALSVTVASGATLGTINATAARIRCLLIDNAGTVELAVVNCAMTDGIFALSESELITTTALSGVSNSAGVIYSTTLRAGVAFRFIGYAELTEAAAGTWATTPAKVHTQQAEDRLPGDTIQKRYNQLGTTLTGTTVLPLDNTIPQNTEGDEYMTQAITPTSAINILDIETAMTGEVSAAANGYGMALFQDAIANALAATVFGQNPGGSNATRTQGSLRHLRQAGTVLATTFRVRAGTGSAGTFTFNGVNFGGVANSFMRVTEIMV